MEAVIARLENVASRLEATENKLGSRGGTSAAPATPALPGNAAFTPPKFSVALPGLTSPGKSGKSVGKQAAPQSAGSPLGDWDARIGTALESHLSFAKEIGGKVLEASQTVERAFQAERTFIEEVGRSQKPDDQHLAQLLAPIGAQLQVANDVTEGRRTPEYNHNKAVAEALQALVWAAYTGPACGMNPPAQHVQEAWQSAEFWANKVLMEYRGKEPTQVSWVKSLNALILELKGYVQQHHPKGPAWGSAPSSAAVPSTTGPPTEATAPAKAPAVSGRGPPPPPPPAAGSLLEKKRPADSAQAMPAAGLSAVFSQISAQGEGVTQGLRRVTDDMKTKNRADRVGTVGAVPTASRPAATTAAKTKAAVPPPLLHCEQGRKWRVEHHRDNNSIVLDEVTTQQTVYIYQCSNCTIQIKGKFNALTLDACTKTGVVFDDLVASCELVNCTASQLQVTGVMPTIAVDKCDGIQIYLSEASLATTITTAKSSAVNVVVPGSENEDSVELYVPEQFISTLKDGKLITIPVSHSGG